MKTPIEVRLVALERRVALLELRAAVLHSTTNRHVLTVLHEFAEGPANDGSLTMTPATIAHATGLAALDLVRALHALQDAAYIELTRIDGTGHWRITDDGRCAWIAQKS